MLFKSLTILYFLLTQNAHADVLTNLKSQTRVRIIKVVDAFETEIIEEMRKGKIVESCMKIADAHAASRELQSIMAKKAHSLEASLLSAKLDCTYLDMVRVDELYLKRFSRHLSQAQLEFKKL